ncbi:MAG: UDP-N-acetylmuramoyl-L-alanine--D-glutamate ligase [Oscillospiraceae bacterium]|nr:UDP-N-acetylmuramoyl-L-alanine--D-glutamate ligase [Oscillospiraceae bacterium]
MGTNFVAERFFDGLKNKKTAFIGVGVSHNDLIKMFLKKGLDVTVCDKRDKNALGDIYTELKAMGADFSLGENYLDAIFHCDIVFRTPGMYYLNPVLTKAREMGIAVTSEMEVFFDLCPCEIIGITGTDGKTTTTTIITEMLEKSGKTVHKGGNIGRALLPVIDEISENDVAVVELSSFQLISMRKSPQTAVVTNIYPDHLNVHKDMEEYVCAKKNLLLHQTAFSRTVLNMDNLGTKALADTVRGDLYMFSRREVPQRGAFLDSQGYLCFTDNGCTERLFSKDDIRIPGLHNVENYLAAIAALHGRVTADDMRYTAMNFGGVEHRIEFVRELEGVKYYNDSIATSPASVIAGLNAFSQKLIVIAGGSDKMLDYSTMAGEICSHVKLLVLTGDTADKIEAAVKASPLYSENECRIIRADSMEQAVKAAKDNAVSGDIVTLSPASASFDRYRNFEERGRCYKAIVNAL